MFSLALVNLSNSKILKPQVSYLRQMRTATREPYTNPLGSRTHAFAAEAIDPRLSSGFPVRFDRAVLMADARFVAARPLAVMRAQIAIPRCEFLLFGGRQAVGTVLFGYAAGHP